MDRLVLVRIFGIVVAIGALLAARHVSAQAVRPTAPYSAQLRTDPAVGNVQGIQRYGRPLKTDPDEGEGFSYHVYPVARDPSQTAVNYSPGNEEIETPAPTNGQNANLNGRRPATATLAPRSVQVTQNVPFGWGPAEPYDMTRGIRTTPFVPPPGAVALGTAGVVVLADGTAETPPPDTRVPAYQPLIQVKVRVIEVLRSNDMQAASVLDYISSKTGPASLITNNTLNGGLQGTTGATRFVSPSLLGISSNALSATGSGLLVNITSEHINYIASVLATELNSDVITAPEVVTLNGQNVEFVSGSKVPFALGQNVIQGNNNNVQQFFYKHVGAVISVTPKIVNWGEKTPDGRGSVGSEYRRDTSPLMETDVSHWDELMRSLAKSGFEMTDDERQFLANPPPIAEDVKKRVLTILNRNLGRTISMNGAKNVLVDRAYLQAVLQGLLQSPQCTACAHWEPSECTIDLSIVIRLSNVATVKLAAPVGNGAVGTIEANTEGDVRGVANVIQIQSGHGLVMAGLIGERDEELISKVPVLGDLPWAGFLFRSKAKSRNKTETLVFVEATVLDPDPHHARAQAQHDVALGRPYLNAELLDNPLDYATLRAGMGTYLPPRTKDEEIFWEQIGRQVSKASTATVDIVR